ncbi:survival motor neuron protein [Ancylostoma duodenale]|uniref:Survival motor neuron protein n=1 Tax=Ancylostoma duodenale TaxID=51022 RepID=A0A0C2FTY3_9BILA|nr:survival motor neuron protein [Ancylostoma duodenale]
MWVVFFKSWTTGDSCLARYSDDDLYYPAKIVEIREQKGHDTEYLVIYEGYGNSEWVSADDLAPVSSDDGSQEDGNVTMDSAPDDTPIASNSVKINKSKKGMKNLTSYILHYMRFQSGRSGKVQEIWGEPVRRIDLTHPLIPSIAPPPPMVMPRLAIPDEAEALSSMLMAWYMSGYHTGYYQHGVRVHVRQ